MTEQATLSVDLRPKTFADVIGNGMVVTAVEKKLETGSAIAWLFSGPAGYGKTTLALILAQAMQPRKKTWNPEQLDIREINAADFNGVDDVRELVRNTAMRPLYGDYTVIILDEAHKLTEPAQNVLLKPFEDKLSTTRWIVCTTEPAKLIKPLRDRCLSFQLRPLAIGEIQALLVRADGEGEVLKNDEQFVDFANKLYENEIRSPREILMAYEKFANGLPLEVAIAGAEHEPLYSDVARAMMSGKWGTTVGLLEKIKTSDARALRGVLVSFLNGALLNAPSRPECELYRQCILEFERSAFEDGVAKALTTAAVLQTCLLIGDYRKSQVVKAS